MGKASRRQRTSQPHPTGPNVLAPEFNGQKDWMEFVPKEHHDLVGVDDRKLMEIARKHVPLSHPFHRALQWDPNNPTKLAANTEAVERKLVAPNASTPTASGKAPLKDFPSWDTYVSDSAAMTKAQMLLQAIDNMPFDHPELEDVKRRLSAVARANADALAADMKRSAAAPQKDGLVDAVAEPPDLGRRLCEAASAAKQAEREQGSAAQWGAEEMDARLARKPWKTATPFLPHDVEEEERVLEADRLRRERETGQTLESGFVTGDDVMEMHERGFMSKALFDKMHPIIEAAASEVGDSPSEPTKLNMSEVMSVEDGDELNKAVNLYRDWQVAQGHGSYAAVSTLKQMLKHGYIPKHLVRKLRPRIEAMDFSADQSLTDLLTDEEGETLRHAVARYTAAEGKDVGPSIPVTFRFKSFKLSYKYLDSMIARGYMTNPVFEKIQPLMAKVCGKFKAGVLATEEVTVFDVRSYMTDAETESLRASFVEYWRECEMFNNSPEKRQAKAMADRVIESLPKADDAALRADRPMEVAASMVSQLEAEWMRDVQFAFVSCALAPRELAGTIAHGYVPVELFEKLSTGLMHAVTVSFDATGTILDSKQVVDATTVFVEEEITTLIAATAQYDGALVKQTLPISKEDRAARVELARRIHSQSTRIRANLKAFLKKQAAAEEARHAEPEEEAGAESAPAPSALKEEETLKAIKAELASLADADAEELCSIRFRKVATTLVALLASKWLRRVKVDFGTFEVDAKRLAKVIAHGYLPLALLDKVHDELTARMKIFVNSNGTPEVSPKVVDASDVFGEAEVGTFRTAYSRYVVDMLGGGSKALSTRQRELRIGLARLIDGGVPEARAEMTGHLVKAVVKQKQLCVPPTACSTDTTKSAEELAALEQERIARKKTIQANVNRAREEQARQQKAQAPAHKHVELSNLELKALTSSQLFDMHEALESKVFRELGTAERLAGYLKRIRLVMNIKERAERGVLPTTTTADEGSQYAQGTINGPHLCRMVESGYMPDKIYKKLDPLVRSLASDEATLARVTASGKRLDVSEILDSEEAALLEVAYELYHIEVVEGDCSMRVVLDARMARRERAAARLQARARGRRVRRHAALAARVSAHARAWVRAATRIQALWRGRRVRQLECVREAWVGAWWNAAVTRTRHQAATRIQAVARGRWVQRVLRPHRAATKIQAGVRGCLERARARRFKRPAFQSYAVYRTLYHETEAMRGEPAPSDSDVHYLLRAVGSACFDIAEQRARQTSLDFMRSSPLIYKADGCTDPDHVLEWVKKHQYLHARQTAALLSHADFRAIVGEKALDELIFGAQLFDTDCPPEEGLRMYSGNEQARQYRIEAIGIVLALPGKGFDATIHALGAAMSPTIEHHARKVYTLRAFMAIEARIGRCFTAFPEFWDDACEGLAQKLARAVETQGPPPTPSEEPLRVGECVTWTALHTKTNTQYTHWGHIVKFTKRGRMAWLANVGSIVLPDEMPSKLPLPSADVVQLFPGTFPVSVKELDRPNALLSKYIGEVVRLKRETKPTKTPAKATAKAPATKPPLPERTTRPPSPERKTRKRTLPASLSSSAPPPASTGTHRLGDRMLVVAGVAHRARVRVVEMKFDEHTGRHTVSVLQVICAKKRTLHGKFLTTNDVHVIEVLRHFKGEWSRLLSHARIVGKAGLMFRARFDKVHRRHEKAAAKEAARLVRETAPRRCRECDEAKPREAYTASQWAKGDGKRTCTPCQDAAKAERQRQQDEAKRLEVAALLEAECVICCREAVPAEERAIFECAHWVCNDCASEMHKRNELRSCPYCRHPIEKPQQYVVL